MPKITTLRFERKIQVSLYEPILISAEATILPDETPEQAFSALVEQVNSFYKNMNIEDMRGAHETVIQSDSPKLSQDEQLIKDMKSCTEIKVLDSYKLIAKKKPEFQQVFDEKMQELLAKQ